MSEDRIEALLRGAGVNYERAGENIWRLSPGEKRNITGTLVWIKEAFRKKGELIKINNDLGKLPKDAGVSFYHDVLRKNRDIGHGSFALRDEDDICFTDTLELDNCDQNEMDATLDWLVKAKELFENKLDRSKLPYIEN